MLLNPSPPWTKIWSRAPSAKPRSATTLRMPEPRSPTSTRSGPPPAVTSSTSTALVSVEDGRVSSETRAPVPTACSVNSSDSSVPIARSVSLPAWPSTVSEFSPCSAVSSPLPSSTVSSPPPGWTKSASSPVTIVSLPGPPMTVSAPAPDSMLAGSVSASAIRMVSSPAPERIEIRVKVPRVNGMPLTSSVVGEVSRNVIVSAAPSPVTVSVSPATVGMTAASAAAGSAAAESIAAHRIKIRRIATSCVPRRRASMGDFPEPRPGPGVPASSPSARGGGGSPRRAGS